MAVNAQQPPTAQSQFPIGSPERFDQLPSGRLRTQLNALPPSAQGRALQWLRSIHFTELDLASLHADTNGGIFYVCHAEIVTAESHAPQVGGAAAPISPFPSHLIFHSKPGAANVLYLNFSGELVSDTEWNNYVGRSEIPAVAFSTDSDYTTFSDAEQVAIKRIWQRIAEDYAPFDIDVTTERPFSFNNRTAHALITRNTDANGSPNPASSAGGVAYVNVFNTSQYTKYRPAWIYNNNLGNNESYIAEAASHEIGHNLGLSHDGTSGAEYYGGHGSGDISWGPLMGTGYNRNVSHWCKGDYFQASNTEDDLATIAGKISYRIDDHGNTAGTATPLVIIGGTNVVSTTPENDPAMTNSANKGVIERTTDVDIFSFSTGTGPVSLKVNPWIMPSGTRGGNLDASLALYNSAGALVLTNNPNSQTTAQIQTELIAGTYYLHVRNAPAGSPFSSTPSGYTAYGSIGQYFISGHVTEASGLVVSPVAELQVSDITESGLSTKALTVTYSDNVAIAVTSIDSSDIRVTGPNGFDQFAQFVSLNTNGDGTPRTATYAITPPGGTWSASDNGTYTVFVQSNQVADVEGAHVSAGSLGQFHVAVPVTIYFANFDADPGWTLQPEWEYGTPAYTSGGPTSGYTGTKIVGYNLDGPFPNALSVKYATTPVINAAGSTSLTLRFRRWLGLRNIDSGLIQASTNGVNWENVWSSGGANISDGSWQLVQSALPATVVNSSTLQLRWALSSGGNGGRPANIGWHLDDVEVLASGALDTDPPVPSLNVANVTVEGSPSHSCSVTYTDATAVRLFSLNSSNLLVTGPNGFSNVVEFVGADLPMDGSPITGSYSIPAPGGVWDTSDNGSYTLILLAGSVTDTLNNAIPLTVLGTFNVSISTTSPGILAVTPAGDLNASGTVGGSFSPGSITYTLTNSGGASLNWTADASQDWITLSTSSGTLAEGASTSITVSINTNANALVTGSYSDTVNFVNTTTGSGNTSRPVDLTVNSHGQLEIISADGLSSAGVAGGPFSPSSITYTLTNSGGSTLSWAAIKDAHWLSLTITNGILGAGMSTNVAVTLNSEADLLPPGDYAGTVLFENTTPTENALLLTSMDLQSQVSLTVYSPGVLTILEGAFEAGGYVGGPFVPDEFTYTLTNSGGGSLEWSITNATAWLSLSASSGSLASGGATNLLLSLTPQANALPAGTYTNTLYFSSSSSSDTPDLRLVIIQVAPPPEFVLPGITESRSFQMVIKGLAGTEMVVEVSEDFSHWTAVSTNQFSADGTLTFAEPEGANSPARFYRARVMR